MESHNLSDIPEKKPTNKRFVVALAVFCVLIGTLIGVIMTTLVTSIAVSANAVPKLEKTAQPTISYEWVSPPASSDDK